MAILTVDSSLYDSSSQELRNVKLGNTLRQLFETLSEAAHNKLITKLQWLEMRGGDVLFQQGEVGDSLYILVSGRMKAAVNMHTDQEREIGEISQGECVGEMALITGEVRTATVYAIRDCLLARLSQEDFKNMLSEYPEMALGISRLTINRLSLTLHHTKSPAKAFNIALVPASDDVPMTTLVPHLLEALSGNGNVKHLSRALLPASMDLSEGETNASTFTLHNWLTEQEMGQDCVIYQAEANFSPWTQQCLRQADKIIIVANVQQGIPLSELEREVLINQKSQYPQRRELVVLYPEHTKVPYKTNELLVQREVTRHYNIRLNDDSHMQRLARMILDKGIGLVLSGGGAKGFAHLGIFRALKEAGVPIDMVCGTSMGSIIAAAIAHEWDADEMLQMGRSAFIKDKPLNDYTLPIISLLKGHKLQQVIRKYFGDRHIEDLWLNFFCVSGNYTTSKMVIHDKGLIWKSITASVAIPGVLPPIVDGNHLLVDGSVFNNFPVDIMKARYGGKLIGVDLLADKEYSLNYTQLPGGWPILLSKFLPFLRLKRYKAPSIASIMIKSTILSSTEHQRNQVPDLELFLSPPVANFGFLALDKFEKIVAVGYQYAQQHLKEVGVKQLVAQEKAEPELVAV